MGRYVVEPGSGSQNRHLSGQEIEIHPTVVTCLANYKKNRLSADIVVVEKKSNPTASHPTCKKLD